MTFLERLDEMGKFNDMLKSLDLDLVPRKNDLAIDYIFDGGEFTISSVTTKEVYTITDFEVKGNSEASKKLARYMTDTFGKEYIRAAKDYYHAAEDIASIQASAYER